MVNARKILILSTPTGKRDKSNYRNEIKMRILSKRHMKKTISKHRKALVEEATMDMMVTLVAR